MSLDVPTMMRAAVLTAPGGPDALVVQSVPVPVPVPGWVLIRVRAAGLDRSELHTRLGLAEGVTFPRVLGIEATGEVADCPGGEFAAGQQVVAMMGGMGRTYDGGYAEYTCVPIRQVIAVDTDLPWERLGTVPEMLQTAYGRLSVGLDYQPGQSLLVRGGTSSVGMAAAVLAKRRGLTVLSTTRSPAKAERLRQIGVDHVLIDDGSVAPQVRDVLPVGVDLALELVGTPTLPDTLRSLRVHGVACFTGMLSNSWVVERFYPHRLPSGRSSADRLWRRRHRPAGGRAPRLPRGRGGRPRPHPSRPGLRARRHRRRPRVHGAEPGDRQARRDPVSHENRWQRWCRRLALSAALPDNRGPLALMASRRFTRSRSTATRDDRPFCHGMFPPSDAAVDAGPDHEDVGAGARRTRRQAPPHHDAAYR